LPKLIARTVKTVGPGRYSGGTDKDVMLVVRDSGSRAWVFRYQTGGRRRNMGLGLILRLASLMCAKRRSMPAG